MLKFYITEEAVDEALFDDGFNNLRAKIAEYFKGRYEVTNVSKDMFGETSFQVIDTKDDESLRFSSKGNGVACKGHFTNVSLSFAFDKIVDTVEDCLVGA